MPLQLQVLGGVVLITMIAVQVFLGLRYVRRGLHVRPHRVLGVSILVAAVPHMLYGMWIAGLLGFVPGL